MISHFIDIMYSSKVRVLNTACRAYLRAFAATRAKLIIDSCKVIFNLDSIRRACFFAPAARYAAFFAFFPGSSPFVVIAAGDNDSA